MNRLVLPALIATMAWAQQPAPYFDITQGWSYTGPDGGSPRTVDLGSVGASSTSLNPGPGTLTRNIEIPAWIDRSQLVLTFGPFRDTYTVFVNGHNIGGTISEKRFSARHMLQVRSFPVPAAAAGLSGPLQVRIELGSRAITPPWWLPRPDQPTILTYQSNAPRNAAQDEMALRRLRFAPGLMFGGLFLLLAGIVRSAWFRERERRELLWFAASLLAAAAYDFLNFALLTPGSTPYNDVGATWDTQVIRSAQFAASASFVLSALRVRHAWTIRAIWFIWFAQAVSSALTNGPTLSAFTAYRISATFSWVAALAVVVVYWVRKLRGRTSPHSHLFLLLVLVMSLYGAGASAAYLFRIGQGIEFSDVGGYRVLHYDPIYLVLAIAILSLLIRQIAADRYQHLRLASEMSAARSAQRLLLGEAGSIEACGFLVDTAYEPATEVGGDFYQILPLADGALLVAVGDVSGKGLKAAMAVSMLAGLFRTHARLSPAPLLETINRALAGQLDSGFVTCVAMRLEKDGHTKVANAGHPAIYTQGEEAVVDSGLPLGLDAETGYTETTFDATGFTLVSDGVIEAANAKGELFGFDRTRETSMKSASEIAEAARAWGQNDDITVVTVQRRATA